MTRIAYADRIEWVRDARYGAPDFHLGASSIGAVLGVGTASLAGPWAVWQRAMSWNADDAEARELSTPTDDGILWEPYLLRFCANRYGYRLKTIGEEAPYRVQHDRFPWLCVSPDSEAEDDDGEGILDCKVRYGYDEWAPDGTEVVRMDASALGHFPEDAGAKYLMQAATSLAAVPDARWFDFLVGIHYRDVRRIRIWRDQPYIDSLMERVDAWRARHLVSGEEPEYDESVECLRYQSRKERDGVREATEEEVGMVREYAAASAAVKADTERKKRAQLALALSMNKDQTKTIKIERANGKPATYTIASNGAPKASNCEDI